MRLPDELTLRVADFSNPKVVPRLSTLTEILAASQGDPIAGALMLAAASDSVKMDVKKKHLSSAPDELKSMIDYIAKHMKS